MKNAFFEKLTVEAFKTFPETLYELVWAVLGSLVQQLAHILSKNPVALRIARNDRHGKELHTATVLKSSPKSLMNEVHFKV